MNTLILTENPNSKIMQIMGAVIGNTKFFAYNDEIDPLVYDNIVMTVAAEDVLDNIIDTGKEEKELSGYISGIRIAYYDRKFRLAVLFDGCEVNSMEKIFSSLRDIGVDSSECVFINRDVAADAAISAMDLRDSLLEYDRPMDRKALISEIESLVNSHRTMVLATSSNDIVRSTPIEYIYMDGNFYIITEGGVKVYNIMLNDAVSFSIYDEYKSMAKVRGLQASARAFIVDSGGEEYNRVLEKRNISPKTLEKLPINLYLIKIVPEKYEYLDASFEKKGYGNKQIILF